MPKGKVAVKGKKEVSGTFTAPGDNTVSDSATNLMWIQDHDIIPGGKFAKEIFGEEAVNAAIAEMNRIKYAGYSNWRLPATLKELLSIVDYDRCEPAINPIFKNTHCGWYRTAHTTAWSKEHASSASAWYVYFSSGHVSGYGKDGGSYVRPVRSQ
jgi:hypothetical protein